MRQILKSGDSRVDFIVENYSAVCDLLDCYEITKNKYSNAVKYQVLQVLEDMEYDEPAIDGNYVCFYDINGGYYDKKNDIGVFYGIEDFNWDGLISDNKEGGLWLYLYVNKPIRQPGFKKWLQNSTKLLKTRKQELSRQKIIIFPHVDDDRYMAVKYLHHILKIEDLAKKDFNEIRNKLKIEIFNFTQKLTGPKGIIPPFCKSE